ncbi:MAG: CapA family protein [Gammaproteobacteria bacterium]|jgi:poly-gamma-glutamate capsule biosynthesis protein CapA/YwtB (metallophosphatase superfamily)|nr:CapA family protein [Gammaproteobacteria bacterium]
MNNHTSITLQFIGDISLNGLFCNPQHHQAVADNMSEIAARLGSCDLRIGNFESPVWGTGGVNKLKSPRLCTTRQTAECLRPLGLDVALLANNHVYDCLEDGFANTTGFLNDIGVKWLGAGTSETDAARPLVLNCGDMSLGLLNYVGAETNPSLPDNSGVFVNWLDKDRVLQDVVNLATQVDKVLVFVHWGTVEQVRYPEVRHRRLARSAIDAGAQVFVGCHAHCLQGDEQWGSGHIFYGMGNFLFSPLLGSPGEILRSWPELSRSIGLARCKLSSRGVTDVSWLFLHQGRHDLTLQVDQRPRRAKMQRKISEVLKQSDTRLARSLRLESRFIMPFRNYVDQSGGLLGAICSIRPRHWRALSAMFRRRKT